MRRLVLNFHLYGALVAGLFVVTIGITGSIIAFEPELDRLSRPDLYRVAPQGKQLTAVELLQAAGRAFPTERIGSVRLPQGPSDTAQFSLKGPGQVFLNPYTGAVVGTRAGVTALGKIHQIHQRLLLGETGADIVTAAAAVLILLVISGVYLWWPVKRASVRWSGGARRIHFDIHNTAGIYSALTLLVLGTTGVVVHFDNSIEQFIHRSAGTRKIGRNFLSIAVKDGKPIDADQAIAIALNEMPGTKALMVATPGNTKASYVVTLRFPEDLTPGGRSWVNVDQYSGKVLGEQNSRTVASGTRTIIWNRAIHTGDLLGLPSKALMSVSSLMLVVQTITGYYMWWKKLRGRSPA